MSHRQTWLILRDMVWGAALGVELLGPSPGFSLRHAFVEGRPAYLVMMACIVAARAAWDSAHRFAAVLPLGAPSPGPDPSLGAVPGVTRVGDPPYDSWTKRTQLAQ